MGTQYNTKLEFGCKNKFCAPLNYNVFLYVIFTNLIHVVSKHGFLALFLNEFTSKFIK